MTSLMIVVIFLTGCNGQNILDIIFPAENSETEQKITQGELLHEGVNQTTEPIIGPPSSNKISIWLPPQFDPNVDTEAGKMMLAQIKLFQEQYPEYEIDIRVKAETGPSSVFNTLLITSLVAPSALPSIVLIQQSNLESAAGKGIIQPIQGFSSAYDENDWYPIAGEMGEYHDEVFGLPLAADAIGLILNSNRIGSEYISLTDANRFLDTVAFAAGNLDSVVPLIFYQSIGGKFIDDQGNLSIDEQFVNEMLLSIEQYRKFGLFPETLLDYQSEEQLWNAFTSTEEDSVIAWTSRPRATAEDYFISPLPGIGDQAFTYARGWTWCLVNQNINHIEPSIKFMEHMSDPTFLSEWTPTTIYFPVRPSSIVGWDEPLQASIQTIMQSAELLPSEMVLSTIKSDMIKAVQDVMQGISTPEESTQKMMEQLEEIQTE
ncbi:MAG: hypothetical protein Q7J07_09715 [Pelolinea sp.]|nr:hypothetical protein [Pelolinea sp.]